MEAWGIIMTAFTLFAMLVLTVAHVNLGTDSESYTQYDAPEMEHASEFKKAA